MECIGYIARVVSTQDTHARIPYVLQFSLLILAPVLMAGALYVLFGRIIFLVVPRDKRTFRICWVPPRWITPIFVGFDIIALLLQLVGAVMITSSNGSSQDDIDSFERGRDLALGGVIVQIIAFGIFTIAAIRFNFTSRAFVKGIHEALPMQNEGDSVASLQEKPRNENWQQLLHAVNLSTILILVCLLSYLPSLLPLFSSLPLLHLITLQLTTDHRLTSPVF